MRRHPIRVSVLGINYAPEPTGIAPYTTGLAVGLANRGHQVSVLTGQPHYPSWRRSGRRLPLRSREVVDGVRVRRFFHPVPRRNSVVARATMELSFGLHLLTTRWDRPDVVVVVTPPLLASAMATARVRLTRHRPAIGVLVQDLYGKGLTETGAASGLPARAIGLAESLTFRLSDSISVIHAGFAETLTSELGVAADRVRVIRNWTHVEPPDPSASARFRRAHGWGSDEVVVLHAGNMGYKQGLENVVAAAALATAPPKPVRFVLLGDGNQRRQLKQRGTGIAALEFLDPVSEDDFPGALGAADVLLVNERPGILGMSMPSKLTSYFASGKPIIAATEPTGLTARELAASGAGVHVAAGRPDLLFDAAQQLGTDPQFARRLGEAGRRYSAHVLSKEDALDRYEQWILDLASRRRSDHRGVRR